MATASQVEGIKMPREERKLILYKLRSEKKENNLYSKNFFIFFPFHQLCSNQELYVAAEHTCGSLTAVYLFMLSRSFCLLEDLVLLCLLRLALRVSSVANPALLCIESSPASSVREQSFACCQTPFTYLFSHLL